MANIERVELNYLGTTHLGRTLAEAKVTIRFSGEDVRQTMPYTVRGYIVGQDRSRDDFITRADGRITWNYKVPVAERDDLHGPFDVATITPINAPYGPNPWPVLLKGDGGLPGRLQDKPYYAIVTITPHIHGDLEDSNSLNPHHP